MFHLAPLQIRDLRILTQTEHLLVHPLVCVRACARRFRGPAATAALEVSPVAPTEWLGLSSTGPAAAMKMAGPSPSSSSGSERAGGERGLGGENEL